MTADLPTITRRRARPSAGIVHLGLGAFFRAHGAAIIEEAMQGDASDWGIIGVSLRSPEVRDRLAPQGDVYTAVELGPQEQKLRQIESLSAVVFAPEAPQALIEQMADPAVQIVSLTVTEKGYCHIPSTGQLNLSHPDIQHDLAQAQPRSAVGFLLRALALRRDRGLRPFSVLSCDNLPENGKIARNVVIGLAREIDAALADWITSEGRFPCTMVDRIVPATTPEKIKELARHRGMMDAAPVFHEPFRQWVVEDSFVDDKRPAFEKVPGVQLVDDVAPFELMKLRMLNGTHSGLAYLGYLAGYETIAEAVGDPVFARFLTRLWAEEIIPTLAPPQGVDLGRYAQSLMERYANPAIRHRLWQIAMDGSQKLPQRLLGTIADNLAAGRRCDGLMLCVAGWMRYVGGVDEKNAPIDVRDPLADRLRELCGPPHPDACAETVRRLLAVEEVFDPQLVGRLREPLTRAYQSLVQNGALRSVEACNEA